MLSKREQVLGAVQALVKAACPFADVRRNPEGQVRPGAGGTVILRDGDPGEPEVDLSPLAYNWEHRIELEVLAPLGVLNGDTRDQAVDRLLSAIGEAVLADRTLGGLCTWLDAEPPEADALGVFGGEPQGRALAAIVASYVTASPL
jgi:hypothetical protein